MVKVKVLTQILYPSKSDKVHVLKCTQSIKGKSFPLKNISIGHFCAKLTEPHVTLT